MNVQVISNNKTNYEQGIITSPLGSPRSLDEFDYNIIDLSSLDIWRNKEKSTSTLDCINDFYSIKAMVENRHDTVVVYVLPRNGNYQYSWEHFSGRQYYRNNKKLKDMLDNICRKILPEIIPIQLPFTYLLFENTKTFLSDVEYEADFYFQLMDNQVVTKSYKSNKATTVELDNHKTFITTLNITESHNHLENYIKTVLTCDGKEQAPEWFSDIVMFDDEEQSIYIESKKMIIQEAKADIDQADTKLRQNARYKSVLYTNGEELAVVVFEILEQLLDYDLSSFTDEMKEDFLIKDNEYTFIGEIKGVTSNVKNEHISQVELHYQGYCDSLENEDDEKNVKALLIINPLRKTRPSERKPVHEKQINLAKRNGCLIIETLTLLRLFEQFLNGEINSFECKKLLFEETGLLQIDEKEVV